MSEILTVLRKLSDDFVWRVGAAWNGRTSDACSSLLWFRLEFDVKCWSWLELIPIRGTAVEKPKAGRLREKMPKKGAWGSEGNDGSSFPNDEPSIFSRFRSTVYASSTYDEFCLYMSWARLFPMYWSTFKMTNADKYDKVPKRKNEPNIRNTTEHPMIGKIMHSAMQFWMNNTGNVNCCLNKMQNAIQRCQNQDGDSSNMICWILERSVGLGFRFRTVLQWAQSPFRKTCTEREKNSISITAKKQNANARR